MVHDTRAEITLLDEDACGGARIRVSAGTPWDNVVVYAIEHGWMGLECLSGIPGTAGAAPVQNIGAYGADVSGVIASVRTLDRKTGQQRTFSSVILILATAIRF
ncbi:FAD-binding protein [Arcanobacterium hippocoleae]